MPAKLHVFDIDNTLVPGALTARAFRTLHERFSPELTPEDHQRLLYCQQQAIQVEYIREVTRLYPEVFGKLTFRDMRQIAQKLAEEDAERMFPELQTVLEKIRRDGDKIVLISSAPEPFVRAFGNAIGASVADGQHYSKKWLSTEPPDKARRLAGIQRSLGLELETAYGDAMSDYPMLLAVPHPVAVNPMPALYERALAHKWPILTCKSFVPYSEAEYV